ncbi:MULTISPECIES: DUF6624 domain-containing protein [Streptomyces]|uniref:DUF6624 domain-containing protein n=1 Tax=Streptomyces TaxID=1883 RepID=UPI0001C19628|nr:MULTISPECIES: DUF6624 domain-containing protein [Streptomyces]MYR47972.1 hypothetical protein [Streptomyces sp. SID4928]EGE39890.1 hypothetical protein SACT1_0499 [Streptomyces sp. ACT-1]MBW3703118.1 hypothetical protein [Streptomyces griseus]SED78345.1 hypothetical protein SAMN04490359_1870 [Streptomyces griseus]SQA20987.1 Uncharacterised protein [Streptomyces griseus]
MANDVAALTAELTDMAAADHRSAVHANSDDPAEQLAWRRLTARHGDRLNEIMEEYGWPTADLVGEEAARAAWLVAQHADRQLDVQRRALQLMRQAVSEGSAGPRELAFLHDRTLVNEGGKQIYGTQIAGVKDGAPVPWPCEDPERVDELRADVGIEPFDAYVAQFSVA